MLLGQVWLALQPEALALTQLDAPVSPIVFNGWWVSFPEATRLLLRALRAAPIEEDRAPRWPRQQNFPPLDTLAGRQASLLYLGYPSQDLPGIWGVSSQVALVRYQIDAELPGLGESSPETAVALDGEAQGRMCMNREDPSTVFL